jgi:transposase InsO family protein
MQVTRSCYYAYLNRKAALAMAGEVVAARRVKKCFEVHRRRYGSRRIAKALNLGRFLVRRLLREQNLVAIQPKRFVPRTTDSRHGGRISPNLLKDSGQVGQKGAVIVGDITYLALQNGKFCYLATFQDKYTRRIVGWAVMAQMTAELAVRALAMALRGGLVARNAIIHTDRGSQYVANIYRELLERHGLRQSMSGKGNCYDNAQAESFFARFKTELVEDGVFESVEQARSETFSYIEGDYNRIRLHSGLGYKSPMEFEKQLKIKQTRSGVSFVSCFT